MKLKPHEQQLFIAATAALAGAKADELINNGAGLVHQIQDAAMRQVEEWRTRQQAERAEARSKSRGARR